MKKLHMIFDVDRCNNCNNCVLATNDEYLDNDFPGYSAPQSATGSPWLSIERVEQGSAPLIDIAHVVNTCQLCANPPCVNAQTKDAVHQREDGIVIIDPEKAKGRRDIVAACPYGQIFWNDDLELPQKWTFDAHLLDGGWAQPRASQVCPTRALTTVFADDDEMKERAERERLRIKEPKNDSRPRFYYKNLDRTDHIFIGGNLYADIGGQETCLEAIPVELWSAGERIAETTTDGFGDFRFERLKPRPTSGEVRVRQEAQGDQIVCKFIGLQASQYVGSIEVDLIGT
ncbi:4Fe-4S dicluster domain-containing protein [Rhizobium sp. L1K21]|uniref:4Fe-4S dicluster domain-containing protein n=1 Tax=Rhizobium sp. L1K21 TaxID=2954933 RepID=UPI002092D005|nr:4Fe-4S dicluster domain-containing protein [Rhizobium sp. L1K21]MCO6188403.1 oxidoreductase [Rhizobium sp. L1K21]